MNDYHERSEALKARTKQFALDALRLCRLLPKTGEARMVARQLMRSATSVAANYRAVCRARTTALFISKLDVVVEEADESAVWLEILIESEIFTAASAHELLTEADELTRIFSASRATAQRKR
jgi:four helix bundle protein